MGHAQAYRPGLASGSYDAIVVGSGLGGMATAALLARQAAWRVLVLERHYVAGGFTHVFRRPGFEWDVGVHYVGAVHRERSTLRRLFDHVSEGRLGWAAMDEVYDRVVVEQRRFDFRAGRQAFVEGLAAQFPSERERLVRYVELIRETSRAAGAFFGRSALPAWLAPLARPLLGRRFAGLARRTTHDVLSELGLGAELRGVLTAQYGDYGLPPRRSSFGIHALVADHYIDGGAYPIGGAASLADSILPTFTSRGGQALVAAEVAEILVERGRAQGVRLESGERIEAPVVVSDAGVANTFGRLLGAGDRFPWAAERLRKVRPSVAHVCLYLGLRGSAAELGLPKTNLWIYPGFDHDRSFERFLADPEAPLPVVYVSFPSAKDPDWPRRHPGRSTIEIVGLAAYEWFEKWRDRPWRRRGDDYESLKGRFSERLLAGLLSQLPHLRPHIVHSELSTPLSTRHFAGYARGEIYGIEHTPERFGLDWLGPRTPVAGLYLTGQDVVTDGLAGALLSAVLTASAVLGRNVLAAARRGA